MGNLGTFSKLVTIGTAINDYRGLPKNEIFAIAQATKIHFQNSTHYLKMD